MRQILTSVTSEEEGNKRIANLRKQFPDAQFAIEAHETRFQITAEVAKGQYNASEVESMSRVSREVNTETPAPDVKIGTLGGSSSNQGTSNASPTIGVSRTSSGNNS